MKSFRIALFCILPTLTLGAGVPIPAEGIQCPSWMPGSTTWTVVTVLAGCGAATMQALGAWKASKAREDIKALPQTDDTQAADKALLATEGLGGAAAALGAINTALMLRGILGMPYLTIIAWMPHELNYELRPKIIIFAALQGAGWLGAGISSSVALSKDTSSDSNSKTIVGLSWSSIAPAAIAGFAYWLAVMSRQQGGHMGRVP